MRARSATILQFAGIALAVLGISASTASASTLWGYGGGRVLSLHPIDIASGAVGTAVEHGGASAATYTDLAGDRDSQGALVWAVSGFSGDNRLSAFNPATQQIVFTAAISASETIWSLAIDPVKGEFYGASTASLYRIQPMSGAATLVGSTGLGVDKALGFDRLGNLYGISNQNQLAAIDKATGAASLIATLGVLRMEDIAARPETGVMYGLGYGPDYSLYEIDLSGGSLSDLGPSLSRPNGRAFAAVPEPTAGVGTVIAGFVITGCRRKVSVVRRFLTAA